MSHPNTVYRKSAKGNEAIATRQHGLTPKLRSMLILVDGKRGYEDLAKLSQMLGEPGLLLDQLLAEGFIEPTSAAAPPAAAGAPMAPAAAQMPAGITLDEGKRLAVRRLNDLLGPNAEDLCLRIERAHGAAEFQQALKHAEHVLRQFSGERVADVFAAEVTQRLRA